MALLRLAGEQGELPDRLEVPLGLGPEIAPDSLEDLYAHLVAELPGCEAAPLWLRGGATGILLAVGTSRSPLAGTAHALEGELRRGRDGGVGGDAGEPLSRDPFDRPLQPRTASYPPLAGRNAHVMNRTRRGAAQLAT